MRPTHTGCPLCTWQSPAGGAEVDLAGDKLAVAAAPGATSGHFGKQAFARQVLASPAAQAATPLPISGKQLARSDLQHTLLAGRAPLGEQEALADAGPAVALPRRGPQPGRQRGAKPLWPNIEGACRAYAGMPGRGRAGYGGSRELPSLLGLCGTRCTPRK